MNSLFFYGNIVPQYSYLLRPPPPRLPPADREDDRDGLDDLDDEDLLDELGDADLLDELGDADLLDELGDADLLFDEVPFLVRPACELEGFVDALLDPDTPLEARPACDVDGRDPPFPAVLKFPLLMLLLTRLEVFLLLLL